MAFSKINGLDFSSLYLVNGIAGSVIAKVNGIEKSGGGIALVASADSDASSANSSTLTTLEVDTTGADFIALLLSGNSLTPGGAIPTVSDSNSNTWSIIGGVSGGSSWNARFAVCYAPVVGSGHTFTVTNSGSSFCGICMLAFSGVSSNDQNTNGSLGSSACGSLTAASSPALYLAGITANEDTSGYTINDGFTIGAIHPAIGFHIGGAFAYRIDSSASAAAPTFSGASDGNRLASLSSFI